MAQVNIDGRVLPIEGETNILQLVRKAGIDLPTFCYHSELSVYGACRMCIVDVEHRGILAACHTPPEDGLVIKTNTKELRDIRRMALELLLANHDRECTTCDRSGKCKLQDLATRFGVKEVRFGQRDVKTPLDYSSTGLVRDPNKCILCGDCVRTCKEVQGIGVLDFAHRGSKMTVTPAFNKNLGQVDCVTCGQCAAVCPTGALVVKSQVTEAWNAIYDPKKYVIVQIAPAVRVTIGEEFGMPPGQSTLGQMATALRQMGVEKVFDTSFAADLTVLEETKEFLERFTTKKSIPQFTSCCPAWVNFMEQYYPDYIENLSSCRSPQQMFGSIAKKYYSKELGVSPEDLFVISIMPCTAKKGESERKEFQTDEARDVDLVITTQELAVMIKEAGIDFKTLDASSLDMPFGFATGAGVIFGVSGGVSEAVLRNAYEIVTKEELHDVVFQEVRGLDGFRRAEVKMGDHTVRVGVVNGLANAKKVVEALKAGDLKLDLVEVMACPGGCVGGAGQPIALTNDELRRNRGKGLYKEDQLLQIHKAQQNPMASSFYSKWLQDVGSTEAHHALHTTFGSRRRIEGETIEVSKEPQTNQVEVQVCVGTSCYLKGSVNMLKALTDQVKRAELDSSVKIKAAFCCQQCASGPMVMVGDTPVSKATVEKIPEILHLIKEKL